MDHDRIHAEYGHLTLEGPGQVTAGSYHTVEMTYTVGRIGIDDGGQIKLAVNQTSDWGPPQFDDPRADNFCSVRTSGEATVEAYFDPQGYVRPWRNTITVEVSDGALGEGETISLTLGDRRHGSIGLQMQSYPETAFRLIGLVDAFETGELVELADRPALTIKPGPVTGLEAIAESNAVVGEPVTLQIRGRDYWGNLAASYDSTLKVDEPPSGSSEEIEITNGTGKIGLTFTQPGIKRVTVEDVNRELSATSNPVVVRTEPAARQTYWGDIHGQSQETVGTGTVTEYFEYARDAAFLDFAAHVGNDFQITDEFWAQLRKTVREFHEPDNFVIFPGYEWSANTPNGGDHNVYFRGEAPELNRSSNWQVLADRAKAKGTSPIEELYESFDERDDVLIIPHQGGRPARIREVVESDKTPFVEIISVWGVFEWFGHDALERSHIGFVAGSDDHTGRPGASYPANVTDWAFPIKGGLMAARAGELSRDEVWEAFTNRRVYGTTGDRILFDVSIDGARMGDQVELTGETSLKVTIHGTAPIQRIDLFCGPDRIESKQVGAGPELVELTWTGARSKNRHKVLDWSGGLAIRNGRIENAVEFGFDHPDQGISYQNPRTLRWEGYTAGNYQGVRLDLAGESPDLDFATEPLSTRLAWQDFESGRQFDAGQLDARLESRIVNKSTLQDIQTSFTNLSLDEGHYYVRVHQTDGEMAWSSPIGVRRTTGSPEDDSNGSSAD